MAATTYVAEEEEGEDYFFQFGSPDMDREPPHFVSSISSAIKGKRSKRSRHGLPPLPKSEFTAQQEQEPDQDQEDQDQYQYQDQEEKDEQEMAARCLMMLVADGSDRHSHSLTTTSSSEYPAPSTLHPIRRRIKKPKRYDAGNADFPYSQEWDDGFKPEMMMRSYACKSCNKKFHSFQALGGHRASCQLKDSKSSFPKLLVHNQSDEGFKEAASASLPRPPVETYKQSLSNEIKKVRVHECPVCHRNFPSGQALGGHKRTHSSPPATSTNNSSSLSITEQQHLSAMRSAPELDLNMPAEDENDCTQVQPSSAVSVNLGGDFLNSTNWPPYGYKFMSYKSSQPWWMESHQPDVVKEDEADSRFMSNTGFARGRDLGCKQTGLPLITTVN